jgi:hypothetical protein
MCKESETMNNLSQHNCGSPNASQMLFMFQLRGMLEMQVTLRSSIVRNDVLYEHKAFLEIHYSQKTA